MSLYTFTYLLAAYVLAAVFAISALAKWIQPASPEVASDTGFFRRSAQSKWFPGLLLCASLALIVPVAMALQGIVAALFALIVIAGQALRFARPDEDCECMGSLTPASPAVFALMGLLILAASITVIAHAAKNPSMPAPVSLIALALTVLVVYSAERKLRYDKLTGRGYASGWKDLSGIKSLPADLPLGVDGDGPVTVQTLCTTGKPALILAVSPRCGICREVFVRLLEIAGNFQPHLALVVIAQSDELYRGNEATPMRLLIDHNSSLGRHLAVSPRPFAVYLGKEGNLAVLPALGGTHIHRLFDALVNAIQPDAA